MEDCLGVASFGGFESTELMGTQDKGQTWCGRDVGVSVPSGSKRSVM